MQHFLSLFIILSIIPFTFLQICFFLQIKKDLKENNEDIILKDILLIILFYLYLTIASLMPLVNILLIKALYEDSSDNICRILIDKILNYKIIKRSKNDINTKDIKDVKNYYKTIKKSKKLVSKYQKKILNN